MKRFFVSLAVVGLLATPLTLPAAASAKSSSAVPTCSAADPVVWVNTKSKVYHMQGDSYYGKTKSGMYACKSKADAMGAHASGAGKMTGAMSSKKSKKAKAMAGCDTSAMGMASPAPKHKKHKISMAMPAASPAP
jgi:hypothetical protein